MLRIEDMIRRLRSSVSVVDIFYSIGLFLVYGATRLYRLTSMPIFTDEGIYIHWARVAWHDASWRFISLTDGRQPLQTWGTIPFLKIFHNDLLLGGRMFGVASGLLSVIGIFIIFILLYNKKVAFLGTFLYILTPYFLFYDRMAMADSSVNAACIWIFLLSILLIRTRRIDVAFVFGLLGGLFLLAKSSVRLFIGTSIFAPLLIWSNKNIRKWILESVNFLILFCGGTLLAYIIYNIQRLSPYLHFVEQKNATFVMTFSEFFKSPFSLVAGNLRTMPLYVLQESGWLLGVTALCGLLIMLKKNTKQAWYILVWILAPFIAIAFFSRVLFPRYLIFLGSFLVILSGQLIASLNKKYMIGAVILILCASFVYADYAILFNYTKLPFPEIDRGQYVEGGATGYGAKEIVAYVRSQSVQKPAIIIAEGNFGMSGDVLDVFVHDTDHISIDGVWPLNIGSILAHKKDIADHSIYVVTAYYKDIPPEWPVHLIQTYTKPGGKTQLMLLQVDPKQI